MINITLAQIETFIAVAERSGFRAAGERLNLSQSAVSLRVKQIEDRLGVMLFNRSTRSVSLTPEGKRLLAAARHTLHELELVVSQLHDEGALNRGRFKMTALPSLAATILPGMIKEFGERHPNIFVQILDHVADGSLASVLDGQTEFALTTTSGSHNGVVFDPLFRDECCIVVPRTHPLSRQDVVALPEVAALPLLLPMPGSSLRGEIDGLFARAGLSPCVEREAFNIATLIAFVQNGMGVTFLPRIMHPLLDLSHCHVLRLDPGPAWRKIGILRAEGRYLSPAATAFVRILREKTRRMEGSGNPD